VDGDREPFPSILALLDFPRQTIVKQVQRALFSAGYSDLSPAHFNLFPHLSTAGRRLTSLAEAHQVTKQSMGYLIDYLEERGYVERVPDPADRRARLVRLTSRGRELSRITGGILRQIESRSARRLGEPRMLQLRELLRSFSTTLRE
jgi:DNA-binding MarR family transcriptional regulator